MISSKHLEPAQLTDTNNITSNTTQTDTASAPKPVDHLEPAQPTNTNDFTSDTSQMDTVSTTNYVVSVTRSTQIVL